MRALRWIIITGAVILVVAVLAIAIGVAWLNSYIHSEAFRKDVEARASKSLGGTVEIGTIDFDVFSGVKLAGVSTQLDPEHAGNQGALQVKIGKVDCSYAWTELLSGKLKLTGVTLDQPQIVLTRRAGGGSTKISQDNGGSSTSESGSSGSSVPFQFVLESAKVNGGAVLIRDENNATLVDLKGVNANADTAGYYDGKDVTGTLKIADMGLSTNLHVTDVSTPYTYGGDSVQAKPFTATAYGGNLAGEYSLNPTEGENLVLNAKGVDVAQLTAATVSDSAAKLSGSLNVESKWRGVISGEITGEGDAQLTDGKLRGVKLLHDISQLLKIKELDEPIVSKAVTHFTVQNRTTTFIGLKLDSIYFSITGDGTIGFDGQVNAKLVLILTSDAMTKLPSELAASFVKQQDGTGSIAFNVTGTTANPSTDLPAKLLMQNTQIKNVINKALDKLFH